MQRRRAARRARAGGVGEARPVPLRGVAMSVNWLTTSASPPTSSTLRSNCPSSFSKIRSRATRPRVVPLAARRRPRRRRGARTARARSRRPPPRPRNARLAHPLDDGPHAPSLRGARAGARVRPGLAPQPAEAPIGGASVPARTLARKRRAGGARTVPEDAQECERVSRSPGARERGPVLAALRAEERREAQVADGFVRRPCFSRQRPKRSGRSRPPAGDR